MTRPDVRGNMAQYIMPETLEVLRLSKLSYSANTIAIPSQNDSPRSQEVSIVISQSSQVKLTSVQPLRVQGYP